MQRTPWISGLAILLFVSGCQRETPQARAAQDARDVAAVEALQKIHPPLRPVAPQPITTADFTEAARIARPLDSPAGPPADPSGCGFFPAPTTAGAPILAADAQRGFLKMDGRLVILASDSGSAKVAPGLYTRYVGRTLGLQISRAPDRLTIRDRFDRVVYEASGMLRCRNDPAG